MEDLAIRAGMSVRKLQRRFVKTFGTTVQDHVARLRILKACELLVNTPMAVTEIAGQVGFYDHSAFSRKFSNKMGVSPRAYRMRRTLEKMRSLRSMSSRSLTPDVIALAIFGASRGYRRPTRQIVPNARFSAIHLSRM